MTDGSLSVSEDGDLVRRVAALVAALRRRGRDTSRIEVKAAVGGMPKALVETLSAFANTRGGTVLLGLDETAGFTPAPGFDAVRVGEQVKDLVRPRAPHEGPGAVEPVPPVELDIVEFEGALLVVLEVEELRPDRKPAFVTAKGLEHGSYERLLDGDHRMGTHAVFLLHSNRAQPEDDRAPVSGSSIADLDQDLLHGLLARVRRSRPRLREIAEDDAALLRLLGVLDGEGAVRFGAFLALGRFPQATFPQLMASFAVFPSTSKGEDLGGVRMLDRATFEGPIPIIVRDALQRIEAAVATRRISAGARSIDVPEIPVGAVREALVNAFAHRDYSSWSRSEQVRVELYSDRLAITSPGGIWGGRTERELLEGGSKSRNEVLTRLLADVPLDGTSETVSENQGTGLQYMAGSMKRSGLPLPRLKGRPTSFTAELSRHGLLDPRTTAWLADVGAGGLDERSRAALALAAARTEIDDQVLRYQLDMDSLDAFVLLQGLAEDRWLTARSDGGFVIGPRARGDDEATGEIGPSLLDDVALAVLSALLREGSLSAAELVSVTGSSINVVRTRLRTLIDDGRVVATAPPTSRSRRYVLA